MSKLQNVRTHSLLADRCCCARAAAAAAADGDAAPPAPSGAVRTRNMAVPMPLTTMPVSPSTSNFCWYPTTALPPSSSALRPILRCTAPESFMNRVWRASLEALGVRILSIHWYSGSSLTTSSSTKPLML